MIDQLLRPFVCDQLKALMEKLETQEFDARSLKNLKSLIDDFELTRFERYVVGRVYKRVRRMHDMNRIIEEVVIGQSQYDINMDLNAKLRAAIDNGMAGTTLTAPQGKRVVVRPRATNP
jgi:hypothetical protein